MVNSISNRSNSNGSFRLAAVAAALLIAANMAAANMSAAQEAKIEKASYWIGLQAAPVDDALKSHLKIESGLLVLHVVPDAPAAKAGIQVHDVLLKYGAAALREVPDLSTAVVQSPDAEATIELIRAGGEPQSVKITAAPRPAGEFGVPLDDFGPAGGARGDEDRVLRWLRRFDPNKGPIKLHFFHPGIALPEQAEADINAKLPAGVSISVTKEGEGPAKITVKQNDKTWEITEENVAELPAELQPFVKRMLSGGKDESGVGHWLQQFFDEQGRPRQFADPQAMQQQLEELRRLHEQLRKGNSFEELRKQVEQLQEKVEQLEESAAPEKKSP